MNTPTCPNCQTELAKVPQRKSNCKHCGQTIFVKSTPDDRTKRLMTAAQAEAAESQWAAWNDEQALVREATTWGIEVDALIQAMTANGGDRAVALKDLLEIRAKAGDRLAIIYMSSRCGDASARHSAHSDLVNRDLAGLHAKGFNTAQLFAPKGRPCPGCQSMHLKVVSTATVVKLPPASDCIALQRPNQSCGLLVSGWIKRADGSGYTDNKKTAPP